MKFKNKCKKVSQDRIILLEKYQQDAIELLNLYFPKGSKTRGKAMAILAVAFVNGIKCGEMITPLKSNTNKNGGIA